MINYIILVAFLLVSGAFTSWAGASYWWGILPVFICAFCGSYFSRFGKLLLRPDLTPEQREKVLKSTRILTIMWAIISALFFITGYAGYQIFFPS